MCKRVIRACCYKWHLRDICRGMFCIRQYLSKKKEKREKNENGIWFSFKSYTCTCKWKKKNTRLQFFGSCDSRVGPVSQTAIVQIFSRWYSKDSLKHTQ